MNKKLYVLWLALGLTTVVAFQNCSSSMPNLDDQSSTSAAAINYAPLSLTVINSSMAVSTTQYVYTTGGKEPYTYSVPAGGCTIDPSSGLLTAGTTVGATCTVVVTDGQNLTDSKPVTLIAATSQVVADPVTVQATTFEYSAQTQQFVVPAYNTIKIEVWGGGGAGGGYGGGTAATGGTTSVSASGVSVSATGGTGGVGYTMSGNAISGGLTFNNGTGGFPGSGNSAAGGAGSIYAGGNGGGPGGGAGARNSLGSGAPASAPSVPGGGGGGYCSTAYSGGGGGGGYSVQSFTITGGGPAKNSTLSIVVGAGGASALGATMSGAAGRVIITIN